MNELFHFYDDRNELFLSSSVVKRGGGGVLLAQNSVEYRKIRKKKENWEKLGKHPWKNFKIELLLEKNLFNKFFLTNFLKNRGGGGLGPQNQNNDILKSSLWKIIY